MHAAGTASAARLRASLRSRQQMALLARAPAARGPALALRAVAVAAGVVARLLGATGIALPTQAAERRAATGHEVGADLAPLSVETLGAREPPGIAWTVAGSVMVHRQGGQQIGVADGAASFTGRPMDIAQGRLQA